MKRINELLFIRNEDNKIEIDAEIYNILCSETIKQEETMEKVKQVWALAKANPKISVAVVIVIIAIYSLATQEPYERWLT